MFTGLITHQGKVVLSKEIESGKRLGFETTEPWQEALQVGESIAVNGVCLTALSVQPNYFEADLSLETLEKTNFKNLETNSNVHFERSLKANDRLGGHFVQGHVDGLCRVTKIKSLKDFHQLEIQLPDELMMCAFPKGSLALDGVSLTINEIVLPNRISLMIIPHTWNSTIFNSYKEEQTANIEMDMMAKQLVHLSKNYFSMLTKEQQL